MSDAPPHILFLHGLEGSPHGTKATRLKREFGARIYIPGMMEQPHGRRLDIARRALDLMPDGKHLVAGSSLGGWLAALMAWRYPEKISRLLLLVPAIFPEDQPIEEADDRQRLGGLDTLPGAPAITVPARVVIAAKDTVVPREPQDRWLAVTPSATAEVWDDDHRLAKSLDAIVQAVRDELALCTQ